MVTPTLANSSLGELMEKVSILGKMAKSMMVSGIKALSKAMAFGKVFKTTHILVSGCSLKPMDMESISGRTEIDTKASGKCV